VATDSYKPTPGLRCILSRDGPSRPVERLLERLEGVREHGSFYRAFCPAHDDRNTPNLDIKEGDDGRTLLVCRAGCGLEDVVEALGLEMRDLFAGGARRGEGGVILPKPAATLQPCTLETYAETKDLPVEFLKRLGLSGITYSGSPAVRIPYKGRDGAETAVRFRLALEKDPEADNRFRWRKGSKPSLYGLWRLEQIEKAGHVFLVEGESDCHTLWHHGLPALGLPGASNWRNEWADELAAVEKIYAVVEPDRGGETFWERLTNSPLHERLYRAELEGAKDASDLHLLSYRPLPCVSDATSRRSWAWCAPMQPRTNLCPQGGRCDRAGCSVLPRSLYTNSVTAATTSNTSSATPWVAPSEIASPKGRTRMRAIIPNLTRMIPNTITQRGLRLVDPRPGPTPVSSPVSSLEPGAGGRSAMGMSFVARGCQGRDRDQPRIGHATARFSVTRCAAWWAMTSSITCSRVRLPSENRLLPAGGTLSSCSSVRSASRPIGAFPPVSRSTTSGRAAGGNVRPWPGL
jgi:hypothetical protein